MLATILSHPELEVILRRFDQDLADEVRRGGCPHCGGPLHSARYPRKPRGNLPLGQSWRWRESFCCAQEGCRRRATPPSVKFLGRRVYPAVLVVLVSALAVGLDARHVRKLRAVIGVDRRTLERWRLWWREHFPATNFYRIARARLMPPPELDSLPLSLVRHFGGFCRERVARLLRFLSPLTTTLGDHGSRAPS